MNRPVRFEDIADELRTAYDGGVDTRDRMEKSPWKLEERAGFLGRTREEGHRILLEIGAGTGQDSLYFQEHGLDVVAADLSPAMVARCREKNLNARLLDVLQMDVAPESFDAVYAMNCFLHVPNADLPAALESVRAILRPGGLFFLGVYGGDGGEGIAEHDHHVPPRFFSWRTDEQIQAFAREHFAVVDFHVVPNGDYPFQSLTLRRPA